MACEIEMDETRAMEESEQEGESVHKSVCEAIDNIDITFAV
jgi:hypothetical protein